MEGVVTPVGPPLTVAAGDAGRLRRLDAKAGRARLRAGGPGGGRGGLLGAGRDHRRLPRHRALSGADRVLGRRGREPAQFLRLFAALAGPAGERAAVRGGRGARRQAGERRFATAAGRRASSRPTPPGRGPGSRPSRAIWPTCWARRPATARTPPGRRWRRALAAFPTVDPQLSRPGAPETQTADAALDGHPGDQRGDCRSPTCRKPRRRSAGWWTTDTGWSSPSSSGRRRSGPATCSGASAGRWPLPTTWAGGPASRSCRCRTAVTSWSPTSSWPCSPTR